MKQTFLLTGYSFDGFHGSMMHICELAEELISRDFKVYIAAVDITPDIKNYVEKEIKAKLFFIENLPLDIEYDYVLSYHSQILPYLIEKGLKYKKLGLGSLSSIMDKEIPGLPVKFNIPLFVHNERLKEIWHEKLSIENNNIIILTNSVPGRFNNFPPKQNSNIKSAAIVSNHVPSELIDAKRYLEKNQIKVDIYGKDHICKAITPEILNNYDIIITIGKTVQYCLYMGIPVYCYDWFGGEGYITLSNISDEEYYNFSGRRTFRKLSGKEIASEIIADYNNIIQQQPELSTLAKDRYAIATTIDKLLKVLDSSDSKIPESPEWFIYKKHCYENLSEIIRLKKALNFSKNFYYFSYKILNKVTFGKCYKNKFERAKKLHKYILE